MDTPTAGGPNDGLEQYKEDRFVKDWMDVSPEDPRVNWAMGFKYKQALDSRGETNEVLNFLVLDLASFTEEQKLLFDEMQNFVTDPEAFLIFPTREVFIVMPVEGVKAVMVDAAKRMFCPELNEELRDTIDRHHANHPHKKG